MSCKIGWKHKKNTFKLLSILLIVAIVIGFKVGFNLKTQAAERTEPSFSISDLEYTPSNPKVGEDIIFTGKIIPNDFITNIPENDIVLVLDVSGSMERDYPYINHRVEDYGRRGYYCKDCGKYVERNHVIDYVKNDKLVELKKAANNFIDKMKSIPNVKIGIVAYSSKAWVNPVKCTSNDDYNPDYESNETLLLDSNNQKLKDMINCLEAAGGTNTGEGIRKGFNLLNSSNNKDARKTIILMSDGEPTHYSCKDNGEYYTDLDYEDHYIGGTGNNDEDGKCLEYTLKIGKQIQEKSYNAFTIGYGLDESRNAKMKEIQKSMTGIELSNAENINEENGFFATSTGAIDGVFRTIADKILNEYPITNVQLNLNMNENFSLNIGGNIVSLSNINYKLKERNGSRLIYSAEEVPFSFRIKANKKGEYKDIFSGSTVSIPWKESLINLNVGRTDVNILGSGTPVIKARLDTPSFTGSGPFDVNYTIIPEQFRLGSGNGSTVVYDENGVKDVVILIDESIPKGQVYNSIVNNILSDEYFAKKDTRYSLIVYGKDGYKYCKLDDYYDKEKRIYIDSEINNAYNNMQNQNLEEMNKKYSGAMKQLVSKMADNLGRDSSEVSIKEALKKADELLSGQRKELFTSAMDANRGELTNNKNIVIIGKSNISDIGDIDKVNSDCKVITFNYGKINSSSKDSANNICELHYKLIGKEMKSGTLDKKSDYYYLNLDYNKYINSNYNKDNDDSFFADVNNIGGNEGKETNNIQNSIMGNIDIDLKDNNSNVKRVENEYEFKVKLKFQVGNDISVGNTLNNSSYPYDNESSEIFIRYTLDNSDGYYKASEQQYTFVIEPRFDDSNSNKNILKFGNTNKIVYKEIDNEDMGDEYEVDTPIINVYTPKHGLYVKRNSEESYYIDESFQSFPKNSFATFAAEIKYAKNGDNIKLTLPEGVEVANGEPEIWKVVDGRPIKTSLTLTKNKDENSYSGTINNLFTENNDNNTVLVIYTVKIPQNDGAQYTNTIKVNDGKNADAHFQVNGELPDLF